MKILLVEDDECIAKTLEKVLDKQNYVVDVAKDGQSGWELVEAFTYDLIVLDIILPKLNGINFCQRLRAHNYQTPVMLLTAKNSGNDKVIGLDAGADDYVVKPFEVQELLARIRVLLRRKAGGQPILAWENLRLDAGSCEVTYNDCSLHLTPKEYRLLELFLRNGNCVLSRDDILDRLWSVEEAPGTDTVTAHIKGLRQKLKQAGAPSDLIETVYGLGYRLKLPASLSSNCRLPHQAALTAVWEKFKGQNSDRITILEQAATAICAQKLDAEFRQTAITTAHKLAGTLGVFGFTEGSRLAFEVEQMLQSSTLTPTAASQLKTLVGNLRQQLQQPAFNELKSVLGHKYPVILLVDNNPQLAQALLKSAQASGIKIKLATNILAVQAAIDQPPPELVLLNISLAHTREDDLTLLAELANRTPPIPVLLFTSDQSLATRVKLSRLFVHAFLQTSLIPEQLLKAITTLLTKTRNHAFKVMVVDDDPQLLVGVRSLLEPWGLNLITLDDPLSFWEILAESSPDLLILDVEMPHFSGIELCQVVRNAPEYQSLPVLFLTIHTDDRTVQQIFTAGADECLSKSMLEPQLVTHIFNRLEKIQLFQSIV